MKEKVNKIKEKIELYKAKETAQVKAQEVGHFLGLRHSNDTLSLMYPIFSGENLQLSRNDSLTLIDIYDDPKH